METVAENLERVREHIRAAARRSGRQPEAIRLVAVTKTVAGERIREAAALGIREIGENYVQEAAAKLSALAAVPITRHFIGHLQRNKASRAVQLFDIIQTIDSLPLAVSLSRHAAQAALGGGDTRRELEVLLEVNVAGEASKSGVAPEAALSLAEQVASLPSLKLGGLMGLAPLGGAPDEARRAFRRLRALYDELPLPHRQMLSMGMTGDFEIAIEEGSTMVRIGTGIFGQRRTPA
jgi:pyridoxal phosphate enzyme (YggS family)